MAPSSDAGPSNAAETEDEIGNLFESLTFYVSKSLRPDTADIVRRVLKKNGASLVTYDEMDKSLYIITESHHLERDQLDLDASAVPPLIVTVSQR